MDRTFFKGNRQSLYDTLAAGTLVVLYSGHAPRKTADEPYPFFADRSFVYMTGVTKENIIFNISSYKKSLIYEYITGKKSVEV